LSPSWYAYKPVHCTRTTNPTKRIIFFSMRQDLISAQQSGVARARNFRSPKSTTTCSPPRTPLSQPCSLLLGAAAGIGHALVAAWLVHYFHGEPSDGRWIRRASPTTRRAPSSGERALHNDAEAKRTEWRTRRRGPGPGNSTRPACLSLSITSCSGPVHGHIGQVQPTQRLSRDKATSIRWSGGLFPVKPSC
jgi:hypothetical protein